MKIRKYANKARALIYIMKELKLTKIRVKPENKIIPTENVAKYMEALTGKKIRWS